MTGKKRKEIKSKEIDSVKHVLIGLSDDSHNLTDINYLLNEKDKHIQLLEKQIQSYENQVQRLREDIDKLHESRDRVDMTITLLNQRIKTALGFTSG